MEIAKLSCLFQDKQTREKDVEEQEGEVHRFAHDGSLAAGAM